MIEPLRSPQAVQVSDLAISRVHVPTPQVFTTSAHNMTTVCLHARHER